MDLIDLHSHTTASDGSLTPSEVIELAIENGLKALAVTDHDSLDGVPEALSRGEALGFEVIPGVEISADFRLGTMHILGYFVDYTHPELTSKLETLQDARRNRNPRIVAKLNGLGLNITMDEIEAAADGGQIGRPHFAQVMIKKGYVRTAQEAFNRYLAKGGPAYEDKFRFSPKEAIGVIRRSGGIAVLAHPFTLNLDDDSLEAQLTELVEDGLGGLEVYYSEHTEDMTKRYMSLAEKFGLARTGGSDFHGKSKPEIQLGYGYGNMKVPYELLVGLKKRRGA